MQLEITIFTTKEYGEEKDCELMIHLKTKEEDIIFSVGEDAPEDMTMTRQLSSLYDIPAMLRAAYEAGVRGESLEVISNRHGYFVEEDEN